MSSPTVVADRILWIDVLRALAVSGVVMLHGIDLAAIGAAPASVGELLGTSVLYFIGRLGVPLFLMITGVLLLTDPNAVEPGKLRKRIIRVLAAYGFCLAVGFVVNAGLNPTGMPMAGPAERSLVGAVDAGWYLRLLIMLYVILPLFHASVRSLETTRLALPIIVCIAASALLIDFRKLAPVWVDLQFFPHVLFFILYPVIGYLIHERKALAGVRSVWLGTAFICALALHTAFTIALSDRRWPWVIWYDSSFLLVASSAAFEAFRRAASGIRPNVFWNALAAIGRLAFGIYLVHLFIMYFWYPSLKSFGFLEFVGLSASTTLVASIVVAWLLLRVPGLRTILR